VGCRWLIKAREKLGIGLRTDRDHRAVEQSLSDSRVLCFALAMDLSDVAHIAMRRNDDVIMECVWKALDMFPLCS
jgi:hypothetical protein